MLPKRRRMQTETFESVLKNGRLYRTDYLTARILPAPELEASVFAFVVPKKTEKSGVRRTFMRRRGYHAIRDLTKESRTPVYGIFFARQGAEGLSFDALKGEVKIILKKAGVLDN